MQGRSLNVLQVTYNFLLLYVGCSSFIKRLLFPSASFRQPFTSKATIAIIIDYYNFSQSLSLSLSLALSVSKVFTLIVFYVGKATQIPAELSNQHELKFYCLSC